MTWRDDVMVKSPIAQQDRKRWQTKRGGLDTTRRKRVAIAGLFVKCVFIVNMAEYNRNSLFNVNEGGMANSSQHFQNQAGVSATSDKQPPLQATAATFGPIQNGKWRKAASNVDVWQNIQTDIYYAQVMRRNGIECYPVVWPQSTLDPHHQPFALRRLDSPVQSDIPQCPPHPQYSLARGRRPIRGREMLTAAIEKPMHTSGMVDTFGVASQSSLMPRQPRVVTDNFPNELSTLPVDIDRFPPDKYGDRWATPTSIMFRHARGEKLPHTAVALPKRLYDRRAQQSLDVATSGQDQQCAQTDLVGLADLDLTQHAEDPQVEDVIRQMIGSISSEETSPR